MQDGWYDTFKLLDEGGEEKKHSGVHVGMGCDVILLMHRNRIHHKTVSMNIEEGERRREEQRDLQNGSINTAHTPERSLQDRVFICWWRRKKEEERNPSV